MKQNYSEWNEVIWNKTKQPQFIPSHLVPSHLTSSHLISCHLISCHPISSHLISSFDTDFLWFFWYGKTFRQMMTYAFTQKNSYTHFPCFLHMGTLYTEKRLRTENFQKQKNYTQTFVPTWWQQNARNASQNYILVPHNLHQTVPGLLGNYYKPCLKHSQYHFVIQTLHEVVSSTTLCCRPISPANTLSEPCFKIGL